MKTAAKGYLTGIYQWQFLIGLVVFPSLGLTLGKVASLSYLAGLTAITLMLALWHLTIAIGMRGDRPRAGFVAVLVIARYALIGGVVYAIMRLLGKQVQPHWLWFFVGVCTFLPSLLINDTIAGKHTATDDPQER